jgi:hypothetical protein
MGLGHSQLVHRRVAHDWPQDKHPSLFFPTVSDEESKINDTLRQDEDHGVVHDGVEPVGDGDDGTVRKLALDRRLDERIGLQVDGRRGLVQDEDLGLPQQRPSGNNMKLSIGPWQDFSEAVFLVMCDPSMNEL